MNKTEMLTELKQIAKQLDNFHTTQTEHDLGSKRLFELGLVNSVDGEIVEEDNWYDIDCINFAIKVLEKIV